jgi:Family of unknown function (DUF6481)
VQRGLSAFFAEEGPDDRMGPRGFKEPTLAERQALARKAKQAAFEKLKAVPGPGHPEYEARQAEFLAREERRKVAEAAATKAKAEKAAAEEARRLTEAAERKAAEELAHQERLVAEAALEIERKTARDARYAARKAAKKKG